jgi:4-amino-4-deoxy-L-arabinose transferase-like glycosyltransferase
MRRYDFALLLWTALCGLVMLVGGLSASAHGLTRSVSNPEGYSRTIENWPWPLFDGADITLADSLNNADHVHFDGYVWQGGPDETVWRIVHTGNVVVRVDGQIALEVVEAGALTSDEVAVSWHGDWLHLRIDYRPVVSERFEMGIYERAPWVGWRLLQTHRLYVSPPERSLAQREDAIFWLTSAGLGGMVIGLAALLFLWMRRRVVWQRWETWAVAGLILLALALRLILLHDRAAFDDGFFYLIPGSDNYVLMARETLAGESHIAGAFFAPGNTIWMVVLTAIFGPHMWNLYLVNALLGAASVGLIAGVGWMAFGRRAGLLAGFTASVFPPLIFYQSTLQAAAPLSVLAAAIALASVWALRHPIWRRAAVLGTLLGVSALFRLTSASTGGAFLLALLFTRRQERKTWRDVIVQTLAAAGFAILAIVPQTFANFSAGQQTFINANGPQTLYWGLNRDGNGADERGQAWFVAAYRGGDYMRAVIEDLRDFPIRSIELLLHKWGLLWSNTDIANNVDYQEQGLSASSVLALLSVNGLWGMTGLVFLGLTGLGVHLLDGKERNPYVWFVLWAVVLMTLSTIAFTVFGRMRAPLWPLLCIPAGAALAQLTEIRSRFKPLLLSAVVAVVVIGAVWGFKTWLPRKHFFYGDLPATTITRSYDFNDTIRLLGFAPVEINPRAGGYLYLTLFWEVTTAHSDDHILRIFLVDPEGEQTGGRAVTIGEITYPAAGTSQWPVGAKLAESYLVVIPDDAPDTIDVKIGLMIEGTMVSDDRISLGTFRLD